MDFVNEVSCHQTGIALHFYENNFSFI